MLDPLYGAGRRYISKLHNWDLVQTVVSWGRLPPAGAVVIDKALTDRIFALAELYEKLIVLRSPVLPFPIQQLLNVTIF